MPANEALTSEPRPSSEVGWVLDLGERTFAILLSIPFLWAFAKSFALHPTFVLITASEMLSVFFILVRRRGPMATAPLAAFLAFAGTGLPLLVRPGGVSLVPVGVYTSLMMGGLALGALSKLYLNRSFGLIAANRGVKVKGPYRFVRHPMYLGYILDQVGFLLASFSFTNLIVYLSAWSVQLLRIGQEEKMLRLDPAYQQFAGRVRARLIPGVY